MLTPSSGYTVAQYWNAIRSGKLTHVRLTWTARGIVLTDEDINSSGAIQMNDLMNGDTDLTIGKAVMKELHISIFNSSKLSGFSWTGEFTFEMGVEIDDETRWVTIGTFSGSRPEKITTVNVIDFTAYDRMQKFDVQADEFFKKLTYPKTLNQIYHELCDFVGVGYVAGNELPNIMNRSFTTSPVTTEGYTCRDVLAWIAEACGCYAKINSAGKCQMVWFTDQTSYALTGDDEYQADSFDIGDGMTWGDVSQMTWQNVLNYSWGDLAGYNNIFSIHSLTVKQTEDDVGISYPTPMNKRSYLIVDNPFLIYTQESDKTNYIIPLYNRLKSFGGYLPATIQCVGNWLVETGDIITVVANGRTIALPIFCKNMLWNGSCTDVYEATGRIDRDPVTAEKKSMLIQGSRYHKFIVDIDQLYSEIGDTNGHVSVLEQRADSITLEVTRLDEDNEENKSKIEQNADGITALVSKTGVNSLGQSETLYSKISQTESNITTIVTKTGINSLGQGETLYSEISQNASDISTVVTKTGINNLGQDETLYSRINQTAEAITTEVNKKSSTTYSATAPTNPKVGDLWCRIINWGTIKANYTWGQLKTMKWRDILNGTLFIWNGTVWALTDEAYDHSVSSRITQTADQIQTEVTRAMGAEGTLSSRITQTADQIQTEVTRAMGAEGTLSSRITQTAEEIMLQVNGKYNIQSGIDIVAEGITVSGGKYVKIESGGTFDVESTNFKLSSTDKILTAGDWNFSDNGIEYKLDTNNKMSIYAENSQNEITFINFKVATEKNNHEYTTDLQLDTSGGIRVIHNIDSASRFPYLGAPALPFGEAYVKTMNSDNLYPFDSSADYVKVFKGLKIAKTSGFDATNDCIFLTTNGSTSGGQTIYPTELMLTYSNSTDNESFVLHITDDLMYPTCTQTVGAPMCGTAAYPWYAVYSKNFWQPSSRSRKHAIKSIFDPGEVIDELKPVSFVYNGEDEDDVQFGLIYEDTVDILPEICNGDKNGEDDQKGIDYIKLVPLLLKEIQSLRKRVAILET